jgi:endoglycosylceramidase
MLQIFFVVVAVVLALVGTQATVTVDQSSFAFKDEHGRSLIFHGVNAVYKIAPWYPANTGFDSTTTLSDTDSKNLHDWGFNIVRLGVMWPGVEPGVRGAYNQTYLDEIETIVTSLGKQNIQVILDFHQDIWHRKFCGEGVPDYVFETCQKSEPEGTKAFPLPAVKDTMPLDADGNPTLEACLKNMFGKYYLSAEVGAGFQCLYDNKDNLWDAFAGYWVTVANRFKSTKNVLGYELINEPWAGDVYAEPKSLLPHYAEKNYLQPMYQYLHNAIRKVDNNKIIFFEGLTIDYWQNGFTAAPGPAEYNDRQVLAYHIYCPMDNASPVLCDAIDDVFFQLRRKDSSRLGVGMIMTEFGAAEDIKNDLLKMASLMDLADRHQQSWMYWQFKYYQDITTITPEGESLYNADGTICEDKMKILSRTYPQATAGKLISYRFNVESKRFEMSYAPFAKESFAKKDKAGLTTDIYTNRQMSYPHGVKVTLTSSAGDNDAATLAAVSVQCPGLLSKDRNYLQIVQTAPVVEGVTVSVAISPCNLLNMDACTCK